MIKSGFAHFHPIARFLYFFGAATLLFMFPHPWFILTSLGFILLIHVMQGSLSGKGKQVAFYAWMSVLVVVINPLLSSRGETPLIEIFAGRVITVEAVVYGLIAGSTLFTLLLWIICAQSILRIHEMVYLFRMLTPKGAMLLAMAMRSFSLITMRFQQFALVHQHDVPVSRWQSIVQRMKQLMCVVRVMLHWMLEEGVHLADSMKSRGFGSSQRTNYRNYQIRAKDRWLLGTFFVFGILLGVGWIMTLDHISLSSTDISFSFTSQHWMIYSVLLSYWCIPLLLAGKENWIWRTSSS